ncbi:splicing factor 3B subunit 4-like [Lucilia cuprina]|uniref:splicing factor 3B subunit 4-like n=1 Tax=Lucilia cuprina TaxID=7375 RepID=UPI001F056411|nr:splicing factor 3B subunit 4-like [Lucilia cuprina]
MQDFRKKLNVAAALRQQQQQQQQQQHHNQNMAVFPHHHHHHQQPVRPHHLISNWNLLNPAGFGQRPGTHLPPPLMHSPHAMAQMPRNPALFSGSLMAPRFQTPPLHNNLPSQQFNTTVSAANTNNTTPFDFYTSNKILMNQMQ